ncbi:sensor histidine kinase KdpD [Nocardia sp. BMG51109]|uniref:sensor histidine kinase n=1 Tax=Nocardia sp. BMG51109 TaxID=1056816 RepID=UPI000464E454|nr:HAMP domain-containing sensor histidine kinase [Nocardia sp. BMG51109]
MRNLSLRTRVALATGIGASVIVAALAFFLSVAIARNNIDHLDDELDTAVDLVELNADTAELFLGRVGDAGAFAVTLRDNGIVTASTPTQLPPLPDGHTTRTLGATEYRIHTDTIRRDTGHRLTIAVAAPTARAQTVTRTQQRRVLLTGAAAVLVATALGWILGGRAVRPLVDLTDRISRGSPAPDLTGAGTGAREAGQLSAAVTDMLDRINHAQNRTEAALDTARTFASTAAHELRTPLTAMRTDLEVMRGLDLPLPQRTDIINDVLRKQTGIESTLTALEQLASGELARDHHYTTVDLIELADEAARDAARHHPDVTIEVRSDPPLPVHGLPSGLRLILDNALTNAIKHGRATTIHLTAHHTHDRILITIDDNGTGIPPTERDAVFTRFYRGSTATRDGSGLGLALVAQQTELHNGRAYFTDSPLGGTRLTIDIAATRPHHRHRQ